MKSIVVYYSQTGSTKEIAQAIHKDTSQLEENCRITKVNNVP